MVTYIATVFSKPGHEDQVMEHYRTQETRLAEANGFRERQVLKAMPGTMANAVRKVLSPEEMAGHPEKASEGTHFIVVEKWNSIDDRIAFSLGAGRSKNLIEHLHAAHTHEFYEEI